MKLTLPNKKILVKLNRQDETNLHATLALLRELCEEMETNNVSNINCDYGNEWEMEDLLNTIGFLDDFLSIESIS